VQPERPRETKSGGAPDDAALNIAPDGIRMATEERTAVPTSPMLPMGRLVGVTSAEITPETTTGGRPRNKFSPELRRAVSHNQNSRFRPLR